MNQYIIHISKFCNAVTVEIYNREKCKEEKMETGFNTLIFTKSKEKAMEILNEEFEKAEKKLRKDFNIQTDKIRRG